MDKRVKSIAAGLGSSEEETREKALFDLLDLCESGANTATLPGGIAATILKLYGALKVKLFAAQRPEGTAWMFQPDYIRLRDAAGLILDILAYFPGPATEAELQDALRYDDPRLKFFAISSLESLGKDVAPRHIFQVAASPEMRNWLYERLQDLGKEHLYPPALKTQEAFAESNMVNWLAYPTELGCAPDEIELMDVVDLGTHDRPMDCYLYRFRTFQPHWAADRGWLAGLAGPFARKEAPSTKAYGYTFSRFEPWDSKSPEEHIDDILQILDEWLENSSPRTN